MTSTVAPRPNHGFKGRIEVALAASVTTWLGAEVCRAAACRSLASAYEPGKGGVWRPGHDGRYRHHLVQRLGPCFCSKTTPKLVTPV